MLHQLRDSRTHAPRCVIGEMTSGFLGSSPIAKEIENFASNRSARDGQSPGKIMKKQPTVLPIGEQAPSPPQLNPFPHLFDQPSLLAGAAFDCFTGRYYIPTLVRKTHHADCFLNFHQVRSQLFVSLVKVCVTLVKFSDLRKSLLFFRFLFSHCYYSFLRATEPVWNPTLQVLILKAPTECQ